MGTADRTVQHLRLRAPHAQLALRAVHRLEDALRCASLPDAGERVLLVRRLHLGRLPPGLSPQSLSLLIEQRVAAVGGEWVHGAEARAAHSNTVWFASRLQAAQAALRCRARGGELSAWYWPLALPGVAVRAAPGVLLAQLVERLGAQVDAHAALPALAADLVQRGDTAWLQRHVDAPVFLRWVALAGAQRFMPPAVRADGPPAGAHRGPAGLTEALSGARSPVPHQGPSWSSAMQLWPDWLAALLQAAGVPVPDVAVQLAGRADAARVALRAASPAGVTAPAPDTLAPAAGHVGERPASHSCGSPAWPAAPAGPCAAVLHEAVFDEGLDSQAGGLMFLLPLLQQLGFADQQAGPADDAVFARLLQRALWLLRVPGEDPAWALVGSLLPAPHQDHGSQRACDPVARRWLIVARRTLRRQAHMALADLCLRPARLIWSRTHITVRLAGSGADLRVRRHGLDIDPGWVAWLGRVVVFVYAPADRWGA